MYESMLACMSQMLACTSQCWHQSPPSELHANITRVFVAPNHHTHENKHTHTHLKTHTHTHMKTKHTHTHLKTHTHTHTYVHTLAPTHTSTQQGVGRVNSKVGVGGGWNKASGVWITNCKVLKHFHIKHVSFSSNLWEGHFETLQYLSVCSWCVWDAMQTTVPWVNVRSHKMWFLSPHFYWLSNTTVVFSSMVSSSYFD